MKKKLILFVILMLFLSGCSATANLEIDKEGHVKDNVLFSEEISNVGVGDVTEEEFLLEATDFYKDLYDLKNYKVTNEINNNKFINSYSNINEQDFCSYFKSNDMVSLVFQDIECVKKNSYYEVKANTKYFLNLSNEEESKELSELIINVKSENKVIDSNANEVENDIYTWKYNEYNQNDVFYLKIKRNVITNYFGNNVEKGSTNMLLAILVVIIIIAIISLLFYSKYKKNKLDY